jgi:prepilin-type N-terminal cleavage/methylation domain-containing protein
MKQYSNRSQPGFSLLEILIAAAILPNVGRATFMSSSRRRGVTNKMHGNSLPQKCPGPLRQAEQGFSLIEMAVVVSVILIVSAIAVFNILPLLKKSRADAAQELVLGEMRRAHERAIDERRIYRLTFVAPQTIQLEVGTPANLQARITGSAAAFAQAQPPLVLPKSIQFSAVPGIPVAAGAVPDGFGTGATAIDFDVDNGGGQTQIYFQPDGRALDSQNRLSNGVVYLAEPSQLLTSRAVSLYGSTGRVKAWLLLKNPDGSVRWTQ